MKVLGCIAILVALGMSTNATAETTWGVGKGPLYSGLGFNFGSTSATSLAYGSLGCHGMSYGDSDTTGKNEFDSNCGFGLGYISTSLFSGNRHSLGLSVDVSYSSLYSQSELRVRPGYYFFLNGIDKAGLNLGIGPSFYYDDDKSNDSERDKVVGFFNIGYQF